VVFDPFEERDLVAKAQRPIENVPQQMRVRQNNVSALLGKRHSVVRHEHKGELDDQFIEGLVLSRVIARPVEVDDLAWLELREDLMDAVQKHRLL
jgi:hypothetical protein